MSDDNKLIEEMRQARAEAEGREYKPANNVEEEEPVVGESAEGSSEESVDEPSEQPEEEIDLESLPEPARKFVENLRTEREQLAQERQRAQHERDSLLGRVPSLQRENAELKKRLAAQAAKPSASDAAPKPQAEATADLSAEFDSPEWKAFARDMPEEAKAIEARMRADATRLEKRLAELDERLKGIPEKLSVIDQWRSERTEHELAQSRSLEQRSLSESHPDYAQHFYWDQTENGFQLFASDAFANWLHSQPDAVQQMVASESSRDVDWLLRSFKKETAAPTTSKPSPITEKRQQQLRASVSPTSSGSAPPRKSNDQLSDAERDIYEMREARKERERLLHS